MDLPPALTQACRQRRLLLLWGGLPFPLVERYKGFFTRTYALNTIAKRSAQLPVQGLPLARLPQLPILSLDPSDRIERAFQEAGVPLRVVRTRHDVPVRGRHVLFKLAGDLATRSDLVLSRDEVRNTVGGNRNKRYMLEEAHRLMRDGALLLLSCDPAGQDFRAWWSVVAPALAGATFFAFGEPWAVWPQGVTCLGTDFEALNEALWAAQPRAQPEAEPIAPTPAPVAPKYVINVYGLVEGLTIGDGARVEQQFGGPDQTIHGGWETLIAQGTARLDALAAQLDAGVDDLKRGQAVLYRQVDQAYRDDLARVLAAVQLGRLGQAEMQATLDALYQAMQAALEDALPMDTKLRAAVADLTEVVESHLGLERKMELALPLLPLLTYKIELGVGSQIELHALWDELRSRWRDLVERFGR